MLASNFSLVAAVLAETPMQVHFSFRNVALARPPPQSRCQEPALFADPSDMSLSCRTNLSLLTCIFSSRNPTVIVIDWMYIFRRNGALFEGL
jgi:hypothetical protein